MSLLSDIIFIHTTSILHLILTQILNFNDRFHGSVGLILFGYQVRGGWFALNGSEDQERSVTFSVRATGCGRATKMVLDTYQPPTDGPAMLFRVQIAKMLFITL